MARPQAQDLRHDAGLRPRQLPQDRRRQAAVELRQSRAERNEAGALKELAMPKKHTETKVAKKNGRPSPVAPLARAPAESQKYILGQSRIFTPEVINDIHIKSELGRYRMRGFSLFKKIPHWDDLTFLP